jgi:hypothetical protein
MRVEGACHCSYITYEAEVDPEKVGLCHCTDCQTLTGTAFSIFVPVPKEAFELKTGTPKIYVKTAESGSKRSQAFCPECGTRIYAGAAVDPQMFNVRVGTLRQRAALPPKAQYWCRSALGWVMDLRGVKTVEKQ